MSVAELGNVGIDRDDDGEAEVPATAAGSAWLSRKILMSLLLFLAPGGGRHRVFDGSSCMTAAAVMERIKPAARGQCFRLWQVCVRACGEIGFGRVVLI